MDRRIVLAGLAASFAAASALAQQGGLPSTPRPRSATAQGPESHFVEAELRHIQETMALGAVTLETSRLALEKSQDEKVKEFARFEIAEQQMLTEVLRSLIDQSKPVADLVVGSTGTAAAAGGSTPGTTSSGNSVASPGSTSAVAVPASGANSDKAMDTKGHEAVDNLRRAQSGRGFDRDYLTVQLQGHRDLLRTQEHYLQGSPGTRELLNIVKVVRGQIREHIAVLEELQRKAP
jgi:putative membrane protein